MLNGEEITAACVKMLESLSEKTQEAAIILLISFLRDGFQDCQNSLLKAFKSNTEDQFFNIAQNNIVNSVTTIREYRVLTAMKEARFQDEQAMSQSTKRFTASKKSSRSLSTPDPVKTEPAPAPTSSSTALVSGSSIPMTQFKRQSAAIPIPPTPEPEDEIVELESLPFSELTGIVQQTIRVLQLLCENHNERLRDYLREQTYSVKSFNVVKDVAELFGVVSTHVTKDSIGLLTQVMISLNEFIMGNVQNQTVLVNAKVLDGINLLLRQKAPDFQSSTDQQIAMMKLNNVILIKSMVENNSEATQKLVHQIMAILDLEAIFETMVSKPLHHLFSL